MKPYAVANVAGIVRMVAKRSEILKILTNTVLNGVRAALIGVTSVPSVGALGGIEEQMNSTKVLVHRRVSMHDIDPFGMTLLASCT
mmetsp:Transcript_25421/g.25666  ORF Transcript_25421/g.25666 Transcript_25421/m.25666 type:complete len:86 (+) Transcript_25421:324-581(+)